MQGRAARDWAHPLSKAQHVHCAEGARLDCLDGVVLLQQIAESIALEADLSFVRRLSLSRISRPVCIVISIKAKAFKLHFT